MSASSDVSTKGAGAVFVRVTVQQSVSQSEIEMVCVSVLSPIRLALGMSPRSRSHFSGALRSDSEFARRMEFGERVKMSVQTLFNDTY